VHPGRWLEAGRSRSFPAILAALLVILAVGTAFRIIGLDGSRPFVYHPDEWIPVKGAMRMVASGDPNPHNFFYPSLLFDLMALVVAVGHAAFGWPLTINQSWLFEAEALPQQFDAYAAGRWLVAAMGVATIGLTFLAGRRLGGSLAGLIAAAIVAVAPVHVASSGAVTTDVPVTLFGVLILLATIRAVDAPQRRRWWIVAAVCVGFATSSKWNGLALGVVPLVAYLGSVHGPHRVRRTVGVATPWLMLGAGTLALIATTPSIVLAPSEVIDWLGLQASMYGSPDSAIVRGQATPNGLDVAVIDATAGSGLILMIVGLIGVAGLLLSRRPITVAMGLFVAVYVVILAVPVLHYPRNALPIVPYLAVGIGLLPDRIARLMEGRGDRAAGTDRRLAGFATALVTVVVAIALIPPVADDIAALRRSRATDTRSIAYSWMLAHIPHSAIVAREQYTPQVRADQFRLRNRSRLYLRGLAWYRQQGVRYLVASSDIYRRFLDNPATPSASAFYHELFALPEVFRVDPQDRRRGPTIRIFELPATAGS
jgi:4-amino-4-deoxy-L-arabinose transferase-like glycosyltransferase